MSSIHSTDDLFEVLGGPACVGRILGIRTEHATAMKRRKSVPVTHWPALLESEEGKRAGINADCLVSIHAASHSEAAQ